MVKKTVWNRFGLMVLSFSLCIFCRVYSLPEPPLHPLQPTFLSNGSYSEAYEISAVLEDGTFIQTQMMVTNIGLKDSNAVCQLLVLRKGDAPLNNSKRFGKTEWNYSDTPNQALSIGHCRIEQAAGSTVCTMSFKNASVVVSFNEPVNPVKTPSTLNVGTEKDLQQGKSSSNFYTYTVLIPWSSLKATMRIREKPEIESSGSGIMVRSRTVGYPKNFSWGWVYYYGCPTGCRFLADFRFPPHGAGAVAGWVWKDNEPEPQPVTGMQVTYGSTVIDGKKMTSVVVSSPDSSFTITSRYELYRFSVIEDLGPILGSIIKLAIGNPVTRFYQAQVVQSPVDTAEVGVLEVMRFE